MNDYENHVKVAQKRKDFIKKKVKKLFSIMLIFIKNIWLV